MARKQLGKYEIIDRLGRGGMAEVYRGYHPALDRYVAIKLLHPFLSDDPEFKDRFENEARNVAKLKHPNIVQVYDFEYDAESESYYMVMELINGLTLKDRLLELARTHGSFPVGEAVRIVRSAAEALDYAHGRGMIHRDVKPANLMLDEGQRVVLTDFGVEIHTNFLVGRTATIDDLFAEWGFETRPFFSGKGVSHEKTFWRCAGWSDHRVDYRLRRIRLHCPDFIRRHRRRDDGIRAGADLSIRRALHLPERNCGISTISGVL